MVGSTSTTTTDPRFSLIPDRPPNLHRGPSVRLYPRPGSRVIRRLLQAAPADFEPMFARFDALRVKVFE